MARELNAGTRGSLRLRYPCQGRCTLTCILTEYDDSVMMIVGLGDEGRSLKMCLSAVSKFAKKNGCILVTYTGCPGKFN